MNYKEFLELLIGATKGGTLKWKEQKYPHTDQVDELGCAPEVMIANLDEFDVIIKPHVLRVGDFVRIAFSLAVFDDTLFDVSDGEGAHFVSSDYEIVTHKAVPEECSHLIFKLYLVARCLWMHRHAVMFYMSYPGFSVRDLRDSKYIPRNWPIHIFVYKRNDRVEDMVAAGAGREL